MGAVAGLAAGGLALGFGDLVAGYSDIPGLVLGVGEWVVDNTPGWAAEWSIEDLGSAGKGSLLPGITVAALVLAALLGDLSYRRSVRIGLIGFAAFGLFGAFATARNPLSPDAAAVVWSLAAATLGMAALHLLVGLAHRAAGSADRARSSSLSQADDSQATAAAGQAGQSEQATHTEQAEHAERTLPGEATGGTEPEQTGAGLPTASPLDPPRSRRAFLGWSAGAGAVALTAAGIGRRAAGRATSAELARESVSLPTAGSAPAASAPAAAAGSASVSDAPFAGIEGLSSWITPNDEFYRIDTALRVPQVDPADWQLRFTGMVDNELSFSYDDLLAMPLSEHAITLSCVSNPIGGDLVGTAMWTGVPLLDLLDQAGVQPGATQVVGRSVDDFTAGFPTEVLGDGRNALLVVGMNGEPLPIRNGFPARLVVAGLYGYVSAVKWLSEVHLTTWDGFDGYWIPRGWSKTGPMKITSRIDVPRHNSRIEAGETVIAGVAWQPTRGISAVQVRVDGGDWQSCDLAVPGSDETWVQWRTDWSAEPGPHTLAVRAHNGDGDPQPIGPKGVAPDGAEGYHEIRVDVEAPAGT